MAHEDSPWRNHRDAKPTGRGERFSEWLGGRTGDERRRRRNEGNTEYVEMVEGMKSARGGSTPGRKKMKTSEKVTAEMILWKGRPKRGKK